MLLAFDLDKTIVTQSYELRDDIVTTIAAARQAGHQVTVLTGRTHASARPYLRRLGVHGPYSVNHGAQVFDTAGALIHQATIPEPYVRELLERYGQRLDLESSCVVNDTLYARCPTDPRWAWAHTVDQQIAPLAHYRGGGADKVVFSVPDDGEVLHGEIAARFPELVLYLWEDHFLEVTGARAHKGAALKLIAALLGVPQSETVAFGDGVNDVSMLQWAGYAVAVGAQAHPGVLATADEWVASPEEGGVARWLQTNVLASALPRPV